jgi:hypothetical protein
MCSCQIYCAQSLDGAGFGGCVEMIDDDCAIEGGCYEVQW